MPERDADAGTTAANPAPLSVDPVVPLVAYARATCGCWSCYGGWPIGESTIQHGVLGVEYNGRPSSCVAGVILAHLLATIPTTDPGGE